MKGCLHVHKTARPIDVCGTCFFKPPSRSGGTLNQASEGVRTLPFERSQSHGYGTPPLRAPSWRPSAVEVVHDAECGADPNAKLVPLKSVRIQVTQNIRNGRRGESVRVLFVFQTQYQSEK